MFIKSILLRGWMSASPDQGIRLDDLGKVNLLIGPNNVGKSVVGRFFSWLREIADQEAKILSASNSERAAIRKDIPEKLTWLRRNQSIHAEIAFVPSATEENLHRDFQDGRIWRTYIQTGTWAGDPLQRFIAVGPMVGGVPTVGLNDRLLRFSEAIDTTTPRGTSIELDSQGRPSEADFLEAQRLILREIRDGVVTIGALRGYSSPGGQEYTNSTSGTETLAWLNRLYSEGGQRWTSTHSELRSWLRVLLDRLDLTRLEPTPNELRLVFQLGEDDVEFSLPELGTGVAELVMMLAFLRHHRQSQKVVFLDEPEAHLHPSAALELIRILQNSLPNYQFIIATHSTALLDGATEDWRIFRVSMLSGATHISTSISHEKRREQVALVRDLGLQPSLLFLAKVVVWVEGPSDAIYLRKLLQLESATDQRLLEGRDFAFAFSSGSSIKHYSLALDREPSAIVDCLSLGTRHIFVCDRDGRTNTNLKKNLEKLRVQATHEPFSRVLVLSEDLREIEDIVSAVALCSALRKTLPDFTKGGWTISTKDFKNKPNMRFNQRLASATREQSKPLAEAEVKSLEKRIDKAKVPLANRICTSNQDPFNAQGRTLGKSLLDAIRGSV